jgi:hypothetical protein
MVTIGYGRSRRRRSLVPLLLAIACLAGGMALKQPLQRWLNRRAGSRFWDRCMKHSDPPGLAVYFELPAEGMAPALGASAPLPEGWKRLGLFSARAVVFLHGRRAAGEAERLVCCYLTETVPALVRQDGERWYSLCAVSLQRGPDGGPAATTRVGTILRFPAGRSEPVTLFAGQPDPGDESRFSFDHLVGGRRGTIDVILDAGGGLTFRPREGKISNYGDISVWRPSSHTGNPSP